MRKLGILSASTIIFFSMVGVASAHVVVKPATAGIGSYQTFDMGVPVEKDTPTIALRLLIPAGVQNVSPNVMPGWKISVKKDSSGNPTEIDWTGNSIPVGERDDFYFSAQVPATATTLEWKAYQTYADGSVVSWDQDPSAVQPTDANGKADFSMVGPYSETQVVNDLAATPTSSGPSNTVTFAISILALAIALFCLFSMRNRRHQ